MSHVTPFALLLFFCSCGGGGLYTVPLPQTSVATGPVEVTRNAFLFGSDYPAEIVIPDIDGMRDTAFVVSTESPAGVVAIDLDTTPLTLSTQFKGVVIPPGKGYPRGPLVFLGPTRGLCLTSSHLIDFNPTTGATLTTVPLLQPVTLAAAHPLSRPFDMDGNGTPETVVQQWTPNFPGGLGLVGTTVYVSLSNYLQPTPPAAAAPGIVRAFAVSDTAPFITPLGAPQPHSGVEGGTQQALPVGGATRAPVIVTTDFNPTALLPLDDDTLLIVNSGVNDIAEGKTVPRTNAGVDFLNTRTHAIAAHVDLGPVALAFQPPTVTADGALAFLGSAAYGEVYAIDLASRTAVFDHQHPITIPGAVAGSDFLSDTVLRTANDFLFVGSFSQSALYAVDLRAIVPTVLPPAFPDPIVVGFAAGVTPENPSGVNTGVGAVATRPGIPGTDFTGPDLFVLTGTPGTLVTINTHGEVPRPSPTVPNLAPPSPAPAIPTPPSPSTTPVVLNNPPLGATAYADTVASLALGPKSGYGSAAQFYPQNVLGPPIGGSASVANVGQAYQLSLGCGGTIVLAMTDFWIADGPGPDFLVFENAFYAGGNPLAPFAEPAIVGVSQDGITFTDFPCLKTPPYTGCAGVHPTLGNIAAGIDPTDPQVAGGDAFDLALVQLPLASYVRVRDAGCINTSPLANMAPTAGFDLDAVAVVHGTVPK